VSYRYSFEDLLAHARAHRALAVSPRRKSF
jgi:hypothetical protein